MKELHTFGWYAARTKPHLPKEAFQPVPTRLFGGLFFLILTIAGIVTISLFELHPLVSLVISLILGGSFASLGFLGHEILHGTVVRKAWLRDFLGAIAFWPLCTGPKLWRKWHNMDHHKHTQDEELDPDAWPTMKKLAESAVLRWVYRLPLSVRSFFSFSFLTVTFTAHSLRMFGENVKTFKLKKQPALWLQLILPWATWIGLLVWIGFSNWVFAFLLPLLIANFIVMAYIATNHRLNPLVEVNDPLANSLTVTVPKWVDVLHFNFSYHTEHHLFPGMNPKYYPLVKEHIKTMWPDRYHEMPMGRALIALWKTPQLYHQKSEFVDPRQGDLYHSLGNGLDPMKNQYRKDEEG
ncbi:fatty acid desaturase family protein [Texcoconibacillus texcoconensis]|uniref:Fatty acid desaturase n=1 Tax=Texcoconibacillus texcoconensis TaxID=1095777 RepID=A0A840QRB0_9BACI|nr:acyl-CoA desaturase [Texcoconibacillus texcoconensis]MBB5173861.1 fatty acid desaturase [Texcoconibacillus texcoconensis]